MTGDQVTEILSRVTRDGFVVVADQLEVALGQLLEVE